MSDGLVADELRDLELDENRQVFVDDTGDLSKTSGLETIEQSVMLNASNVLRPLVGQPISGDTLESVQSKLEDVFDADPQISSVRRVNVTEIDESNGRVTVRVFLTNNNDFEIGVDV